MTEAGGRPPLALTIAGSDSGGGAGIQADLKTWEAFGVYGASVVTCVTAQNTRAVRGVHVLPVDFVCAQIAAVFEDLPIAVVKTGLLPTAPMAAAVGEALRGQGTPPLVVDPVLLATSGDALAAREVGPAIVDALLPIATLITPNLEEASVLAGTAVRTVADMRVAASRLVERGAAAVLVKGGHLPGVAVDVLLDAGGFEEYAAARIDVGPVHGTGCTMAAAVAAGLARGLSLRESVGAAKRFVETALRDSFAIGAGARVLRHRSGSTGA